MRPRLNPWVGMIPWRREWQPTPAFLPGESHGQRSLVGYSPQGHKELDKTDSWACIHTHTHIHSVQRKSAKAWHFIYTQKTSSSGWVSKVSSLSAFTPSSEHLQGTAESFPSSNNNNLSHVKPQPLSALASRNLPIFLLAASPAQPVVSWGSTCSLESFLLPRKGTQKPISKRCKQLRAELFCLYPSVF